MCGICGIIYDDPSRPIEHHVLESMARTMIHRGPDDEGYYLGRGAGLGMRRLSIIDVEGGHQPFTSKNGDVVAVCNGEIYNHREIRRMLEAKGHVFRTRSDAEVLPHLYEEFGADLPNQLNGMFGLAVWDERNRALLLARDRMGEKPLYWTHQKGVFLFASELKAILAHPEIESNVDRASLSKYLAYEYVPAPGTIMQGVHKLKPGHLLVYNNKQVISRHYWDIPVGKEYHGISEEEAAREIRRLLELSVERRLMSDVPLGAFLSGGIDSSSIVAMMSRLKSPRDIKSFSIAFYDKSFDESGHARKVAAFFGTEHHEELCAPKDLVEILPKACDILDEPFADASIIPTYALARFARRHVTVALSGDGGDELFAGYPTFQAEEYAKYFHRIPGILRKSVQKIINCLPASDANISFDFKLKRFLKGANEKDFTRHAIWMGSFSPDEQHSLLAFDFPPDTFSEVEKYARAAWGSDGGNRLLYIYKKLYLADDILTKIDRASMANSLESRAPFLDHELVEFVARLPYRLKLNGLKMKYILKKAMGPVLPKGITARAKKGFGIPVAKWIKGPLKNIFLDTFDSAKIRREGFFKPGAVSGILKDHLSGRVDNRKKLWTLFMFEQWFERWG